MSKAAESFDRTIQDAQALLDRFDTENAKEPDQNLEPLKRAGLIMALAAWETYIKDRIKEEFAILLTSVRGSLLGRFVEKRLEQDLKRFFNPNSSKIKQLFEDYFEIDITEKWVWDNYDAPQARKALNKLIATRGSAAHQANTSDNPDCEPHLIKRDELEKAIRFLTGLVATTDKVRLVK